MSQAAYYIGLGKQAVLCIQDIPVDETGFATIEGMKVSTNWCMTLHVVWRIQ